MYIKKTYNFTIPTNPFVKVFQQTWMKRHEIFDTGH